MCRDRIAVVSQVRPEPHRAHMALTLSERDQQPLTDINAIGVEDAVRPGNGPHADPIAVGDIPERVTASDKVDSVAVRSM